MIDQRLKIWGLVAILVTFGLLAFLQAKTPLAWALVPMILGCAWMLGDMKRLAAGYWLWAVVAEYAYQYLWIGPIRYGDESLLMMMVIALVFTSSLRRPELPQLRIIISVFILLLLLAILSMFVNGGDRLKAVVTIVQYYRPFVIGYVAYLAFRPQDLRGVAGFFLATLLLQFVLNTAWLFGSPWPPHPGLYVGVDFAVGTMGSSLYVGYTACLGVVLCIGIVIATRRMAYLAVAGLLFISFTLTNTVHAYSFLGLMLLMLSLMATKKPGPRVATACVMSLMMAGVFALAQMIVRDPVTTETMVARGKDLFQGRKMAAYGYHLTELPRDVPVFLLGAGPGNLGCAMADSREYLPAKYHGWSFEKLEIMEMAAGSIISQTHTGLLSIYSDLGPLAFLLYWGAHVYAMVRVFRLNSAGAYVLPWQRAFALSFVPAMLLYLLVAFMVDLVHSALWGFYPWVWAALVWTPYEAPTAPTNETAGVTNNTLLPEHTVHREPHEVLVVS